MKHKLPAQQKALDLCEPWSSRNQTSKLKKVIFLIILLPLIGFAHPGIGIVKDSKGNIFYTDLKQVWKITNGNKTVVVPNVHTHELHVDKNDNLYGEGGYYDSKANKFYHYLWVYRPNGQIDTVIGMKEAYVHQDFSLARDKRGNEYYIKKFLAHSDTSHIYQKYPDGKELIFSRGNFKSVRWLHPQEDGSLLYVSNNALYRVDTAGKIQLVKEQLGNTKPSFKFSGNSITIWGVWQDNTKNIYIAVFSDQTVKKIDHSGNMISIHKSKGNWAPLHGVFDNDNKLWVLESSDKNDVRVTLAGTNASTIIDKKKSISFSYFIIGFFALSILLLYLKFRYNNSANLKRRSN